MTAQARNESPINFSIPVNAGLNRQTDNFRNFQETSFSPQQFSPQGQLQRPRFAYPVQNDTHRFAKINHFEQLSQAHATETQQINRESEKQLCDLKQAHQKAMTQMQKQHEKELKKTQDEYNQKQKAVEEQFRQRTQEELS